MEDLRVEVMLVISYAWNCRPSFTLKGSKRACISHSPTATGDRRPPGELSPHSLCGNSSKLVLHSFGVAIARSLKREGMNSY